MFRAVAMSAMLFGIVSAVAAMAQDTTAAQPATREAEAGERARRTLAEHLKVALDGVSVTRIEPRTWSNSSMGCGKPGTVALTVITEGYAIALRALNRDHEVHVSAAGAIVCDRVSPIRHDSTRSANARGLDVMMERARQDLAQRLGVEAAQIRLAGMQPQQWPDSTLGCPRAGEVAQPGPLDGFKLFLRLASRVYTYHTDRKDVRACPAIESQ